MMEIWNNQFASMKFDMKKNAKIKIHILVQDALG